MRGICTHSFSSLMSVGCGNFHLPMLLLIVLYRCFWWHQHNAAACFYLHLLCLHKTHTVKQFFSGRHLVTDSKFSWVVQCASHCHRSLRCITCHIHLSSLKDFFLQALNNLTSRTCVGVPSHLF